MLFFQMIVFWLKYASSSLRLTGFLVPINNTTRQEKRSEEGAVASAKTHRCNSPVEFDLTAYAVIFAVIRVKNSKHRLEKSLPSAFFSRVVAKCNDPFCCGYCSSSS